MYMYVYSLTHTHVHITIFNNCVCTDNYIEVVTSPNPSERGAQLSIMFSCPIDEVSKAIQARGAAVSTFLAL